MFLQGNGFDFSKFFHFVDDQGDYGEIKSSGLRVEMKGYLSSALGMKMELEFIQVNMNGRSRTLDHFHPPAPPL